MIPNNSPVQYQKPSHFVGLLFYFHSLFKASFKRCGNKKAPPYGEAFGSYSDPAGIRTQDPYIKSVMLYQLSYGI